MTPREITGIFILTTVLTIAAYDLFALLHWGVEATISRLVRSANARWPLLAPLVSFAMGCLYGHLFLHP